MPPNFVFIDDWRFPNEADWFENKFLYDITRIRIDRKVETSSVYEHESEKSLPDKNDKYYYDFYIENNGTIEELYRKLDSVLAYLETKIIFR